MKVFGIILLLIMLGVVSMAQTATASNNPPDLQVIKMGWKSEWRLAQETDGEEHDPLAVQSDRRARISRADRTSVFDNASRASRDDDGWPASGPQVNGYLYLLTVRNTGQKEIKAVNWQYIFTDPLDLSLVTRHRFSTKTKLMPGKEKQLGHFALSPPTSVINAKAAADKTAQPLIEQIEITRIEYTDGTVWERP